MAGAIFGGVLSGDARNFPSLPEGHIIKGLTANEYVYQGASNEFKMLLQSFFSLLNPPHIVPFVCGFFDYPADYVDALKAFKSGTTLYKEHHESTNKLLQKLGGKNGRNND